MLDYAGNIVPPSEAGPEALNQKMAQAVAYQFRRRRRPPAQGRAGSPEGHPPGTGHAVRRLPFLAGCARRREPLRRTRNAVQVQCEDCHGTAEHRANIYSWLLIDARPRRTRSIPADQKRLLAAPFRGTAARMKSEAGARSKYNKKVIDRRRADSSSISTWIAQRRPSAFSEERYEPGKSWVVPRSWTPPTLQAGGAAKVGARVHEASRRDMHRHAATIDRATLARYAHTIRTDNKTWGYAPDDEDVTARQGAAAGSFQHADELLRLPLPRGTRAVSAAICRSSANQRMPMQHNEGTLHPQLHQLQFSDAPRRRLHARRRFDRPRHKIVPVRSACAVLVSSQDAQRQWIYTQQQTISAEGFAGTAFTPYFPHTVRVGRNQAMHRLPSFPSERQQRDHGPVAHAGDQRRQFHRPVCLGRRRERRTGSRRRHRARRAAGGDRLDAARSWRIPTTIAATLKAQARTDRSVRSCRAAC